MKLVWCVNYIQEHPRIAFLNTLCQKHPKSHAGSNKNEVYLITIKINAWLSISFKLIYFATQNQWNNHIKTYKGSDNIRLLTMIKITESYLNTMAKDRRLKIRINGFYAGLIVATDHLKWGELVKFLSRNVKLNETHISEENVNNVRKD